jgi:hypothetical protein
MTRKFYPSLSHWSLVYTPVFLLYLAVLAIPNALMAATANDPLDPLPGVSDALIYYFDYSAAAVTTPIGSDPGAVFPFDLITSDQRIIEDRSPNEHHLINFDTDGLVPEEIDQDFLFTDISAEDFALPGTRGFDTFNGIGGLTHDTNAMTHQGISDFGGYTFESYFKRTSAELGLFNLWNPEGMHSLELRPSQLLFPQRDPPNEMHLQLALRGISNLAIPVDDILPLDEWVHLMAVLTVSQPLPEGGNPITDPLVAGYELFVNGESLVYTDDKGTPDDLTDDAINPLGIRDYDVDGQDFLIWQRGVGVGTTHTEGDANINGTVDGVDLDIWESQFGGPPPSDEMEDANFDDNPLDLNLDPADGGPFSTIEKENRHHGIGTQEFGSPEGSTREFPGELAMTRLTYGVLTPQQSLFNFATVSTTVTVPEPTSLLLLWAGLTGLLSRRRQLMN